jgi:hypothetical protein
MQTSSAVWMAIPATETGFLASIKRSRRPRRTVYKIWSSICTHHMKNLAVVEIWAIIANGRRRRKIKYILSAELAASVKSLSGRTFPPIALNVVPIRRKINWIVPMQVNYISVSLRRPTLLVCASTNIFGGRLWTHCALNFGVPKPERRLTEPLLLRYQK